MFRLLGLSLLLFVRLQGDYGRLELSRGDLRLKHDIKLSECTLRRQNREAAEREN